MKIKTGDVFLMWRMKHLINEGKIEISGEVSKGWKDFDVKLGGAKQVVVVSTESVIEGR